IPAELAPAASQSGRAVENSVQPVTVSNIHSPEPANQHATELHADASSADSDLTEPEVIAGLRSKEPAAALPQSKSVRIALARLDRMMNAVGELVINRTRMLGRLAELERLAEVLNFSKARMQDKVGEFQEKYEFSRLTTSLTNRQSAAEKNAPPSYPELERPNLASVEYSDLA